jgi:hypothetical protein
MEFKEWLNNNPYAGTEKVDSKLNQVYNKAQYAVKLVQLYDQQTNQKLLTNITTIAPLTGNSSLYGLYNSAENKKVIGPQAANQIKFKFGQSVLNKNSINKLPNVVIKKHIPDIDEKQLVPSDVIHVNVRDILKRFGDSFSAIIEIASTIVHEATHAIEFQTKEKVMNPEKSPTDAEKSFKSWVQNNLNLIFAQIPQLKLFQHNNKRVY